MRGDVDSREFNRFANQIVKRLPNSQDYTTTQLLYSSLQVRTRPFLLSEPLFCDHSPRAGLLYDRYYHYHCRCLRHLHPHAQRRQGEDVRMDRCVSFRFEMALLRIIGLRKHAASGILIIQVLYFTIPGIICGLLLSVALYVLLASILNRILLLNLPLSLPWSAYILSVIVGLLSPLVAIAAPVVSLTRKKLAESLDYQHSVGKRSE